MTLTTLLLFSSVYALAVATPGPGIAALVARTLSRGTAGAVVFILGFVIGDLIWFCGAALGLNVLAKTFTPLFIGLKYAGCAYLLFIAWQLWKQDAVPIDTSSSKNEESSLATFLGSLFLTLGNPKVMIFFLSIMPLVVAPEAMSWLVVLELAVVIAVIIAAILFGYMLLANEARQLFRSTATLNRIQKANSVVLAAAALVIASR